LTVTVFIGSLMAALALGMPIAFALIVCAIALMLLQGSFDTTILSQKLVEGADSYILMAIPFFILAGELMNKGGMSRRIVELAMALVGHIRGGLGLVAIFAALLMAAISGSASADAAALGTLLIPMMRRAGYNVPRSAGLVAAGSIIAPCMPPSIALIVFGVIANVSIGKLFMATIVPGLMMAAALVMTWMWLARKEQVEVRPRQSLEDVLRAARRGIWAVFMPVGIIGGMKFGIFTATEAAVAACVYALLVGMLIHRELKLRDIYPLFVAASRTSAVILFLIAAALISGWLITTSPVPQQIGAMLQPFMDSPRLLMLVIMVLVIVIGTALDFAPTLMILTPVLMPIVKMAGIDPVYFGVLFIMNNAIGLITPPVGIVLNVLSGVARVPLGEVIRGSLPFVAAHFAVLLLLVAFPQLVLVPLGWLT
jgi:TRAP-type transport system large permease protein